MMTFVNVFTVVPDKQKDSLRVIQNLYREVVRHQPRFVSARLLISDDGTIITAIALWESKEQLAAAKQISSFQDFYNSEFFEATINEAHVYSTFVEISGVLHKHKHRSNFKGNLEE